MAPLAVRVGKDEGANPGKDNGAEDRVGEAVEGTAMAVWGSEEGNIWAFDNCEPPSLNVGLYGYRAY